MTAKKKKPAPKHGICEVCGGRIEAGVQWTLTGQLRRVHTDPDDCVAVLHPKRYRAFLKANPNYRSKSRYEVEGRTL